MPTLWVRRVGLFDWRVYDSNKQEFTTKRRFFRFGAEWDLIQLAADVRDKKG